MYNQYIDSAVLFITHTEREFIMASTKVMQLRAKARKTANKKSEEVCVVSPTGTTVFSSMEDYQNMVRDSLAQGANLLVSQMNPANVDLTLLDKATFQAKPYKVGGKEFNVDIHVSNKAVDTLSKHTGRDLGAVIQIWNGSKSALLLLSKDMLEDARYDWRKDARIKADDVLSQSVASLRLNSQNPAVHHIAMFLAYEHKEMDSGAIYGVWD